jgi:hypothetical protein
MRKYEQPVFVFPVIVVKAFPTTAERSERAQRRPELAEFMGKS